MYDKSWVNTWVNKFNINSTYGKMAGASGLTYFDDDLPYFYHLQAKPYKNKHFTGYQVYVPPFDKNYQEMRKWCVDTFGPNMSWNESARVRFKNSHFYFRNEADLAWFLMRWS
jgi:hypothetical protein